MLGFKNLSTDITHPRSVGGFVISIVCHIIFTFLLLKSLSRLHKYLPFYNKNPTIGDNLWWEIGGATATCTRIHGFRRAGSVLLNYSPIKVEFPRFRPRFHVPVG